MFKATSPNIFYLLAALLAPVSEASAAIVINGYSSPSASVSINIPLNPNRVDVPRMQQDSNVTQYSVVTVTGGTGQGFLRFDGQAMAQFFSGSGNSEYMDSYSAIQGPFYLATQPYLPQGSTPTHCSFNCFASFTFDTPTQIIFTIYAHVDYTYHDMTGSAPLLQGQTIIASAMAGYIAGVYSVDEGQYLSDAVVTFGGVLPTPEPASWAMTLGAMAIGGVVRLRRRCA